MPTYGYEIFAHRDGYEGRAIHRKEVKASDEPAARAMLLGWLTVEGYDESKSDVTLIADGCTFREAGERNVRELATRLRFRFGATLTETGDNDDPERPFAMRATMHNGCGVSLTTGGDRASDPAPAVAALRFGPAGWIGDSERNVDVDVVTGIMRGLVG